MTYMRWTACALALALIGCGSDGGGSSSGGLKLGTPPPAVDSSGNGGTGDSSAGGDGATSQGTVAAIVIDGINVAVPPWFPAADVQNLSVAIDEYVQDARANLSNWMPSPANPPLSPALTIIFHDVAGMNYWDTQTRTAWLEWPKGASALPVRTRFAPLLGQVFVYDRRREQGLALPAYDPASNTWMDPLTVQEEDEMTSARNLAVTMEAADPTQYEAP